MRLTSAAISTLLMILSIPMWASSSGQTASIGDVGFHCSKPGRVVVVLAGGLSIRDIADVHLRHIRRLFEEGSAGLMNVRTGKPTKDTEPATVPGMFAGCLTLGAGAMASGGAEVGRAYDALARVEFSKKIGPQQLAGKLYELRTGRQWPRTGVCHTEIVKIMRINQAAPYRARPGLLGSALRCAGIRTAVVGNSDMALPPSFSGGGGGQREVHHEAAAVAMDEWGLIDGGSVSSAALVRREANSAYGMQTNSAVLLELTKAELKKSGFVVVDFGDTLRADAYCEMCLDKRAAALRRQAVRRLDDFVGGLREALHPRRDLLIVLSPCARSFSQFDQERLAPILMIGPGFRQGLLRSPSTRRDGVVALVDVAPTILRFLKIEVPQVMVGRPIASVPAANTSQTLLRLNIESINHAQRLLAMRGGSVFQTIVVVVATIGLLFGNGSTRKTAAWLVLIPAIMPLAMLWLTAVYSGGLVGSVVALSLIVGAILWLCVAILHDPSRSLAWVCGILTATLVCDLALGSKLIRTSIAGYTLVDGARYYGIGNELMGSMLGATLTCVGLILSSKRVARLRTPLAGTIFLIVFLSMGLPSFGAEAGGAIAAALAFGVVLALRAHWKPSARIIGALALCATAAVLALFALDAARGGEAQSHLGRALELVLGGNWGAMASIAARKLELNFMLVSTSLWSRLLFVSLAASALLLWVGRKDVAALKETSEARASLAGLIVGTAAAFFFNDSGVVAAAACAVLMWSFAAVSLHAGTPGGIHRS